MNPGPRTAGREIGLCDLSRRELGELLEGHPRYRIDQLWDGLYRQRLPLAQLTSLPKQLRADIGDLAGNSLELVRAVPADRGRTVKQLWSLADGHLVESVVMHYYNRTTVCVSSQAGCAMGCT
ncbi:MAG TPA: 23S rRNA (adenine(2503)-C(2))-methyltransferase RlmN, partial [Acidimicrobiaceae bacterium]|nr:23S rRNA (adenine(2503)-C(2))-methyltransferase RlmN [Acidimicrobiaceae bacterium]